MTHAPNSPEPANGNAPPTRLPRLTVRQGTADTQNQWPRVYRRDETANGRLAIAVSDHACELLADLADCLGSGFYLLYVHVVPRGTELPGRYQSPLLQRAELRSVLAENTALFEQDGRHNVWIGAADGSGFLVYDRHDLVYAYGPLPAFEQVLLRRGFTSGTFSLDVIHSHHYHGAFDDAVRALLGRWDWHRTELRPQDE